MPSLPTALRRLATRMAGGDRIDEGSRAVAAEYAAMLAQAGIATRTYEGESDIGLAFVALEDIYGDLLAVVQGTPDADGYLVVPAPFSQPREDPLYTRAWPGRSFFAGARALEVTLAVLAESGLYDGDGDGNPA